MSGRTLSFEDARGKIEYVRDDKRGTMTFYATAKTGECMEWTATEDELRNGDWEVGLRKLMDGVEKVA